MKRHILRWTLGSLVALLAFLGDGNSAKAGYVSFPTDMNTAVAEFTAFIGDFGSWNASQNNMPMMLLQSAPSSQQSQTVLLLWWWWLQDGGMNSQAAPSGPVSGSGSGTGLSYPAPGGNPSGGVISPFPNGGSTSGSTSPGSGVSSGGTIPYTGGGTGGGSPHVAAPAPSALTLGLTGIVGLLLYRYARRRLGRLNVAPEAVC